MYVEGIYVQQNFNFARILVEEAASRGCPHAENNLGLIIGFGLTEEPDETLAKVSFAIAAKKGVRAAEMNLELIA
jgi:TPR repeat protein